MKISINGFDWSEKFDRYSVHPYHRKVEGTNVGTSMSGTKIFDTVAVKSCFIITAGLLTQEDYNLLMSWAKSDYVTVKYTDPDTNSEVTRAMILTTEEATQVPLLGGGYMYKNIRCDFVER